MKKRVFFYVTILSLFCFNVSIFSNGLQEDLQALMQLKNKVLQARKNVAKLGSRDEVEIGSQDVLVDVACQTCIETKPNKIKKKKREYSDACCEETDRGWAITIKNGCFYPQDKTLRAIFDCCGSKGGYWLEGAVRYNFWKKMNLEASGSFFKKEGKALCSDVCTKVKLPTLGLGLKYFFRDMDYCGCDWRDRWLFFLGAGLRVFFYKEENASPYVLRCIKKTTVGGMVNAGFTVMARKHFFIDLFADYNFKKLCLDCDDVCVQTDNITGCCKPSYFCKLDLGGVVAGIGLGGTF